MNRIKALLYIVSFLFTVNVCAKDYDALLSWPARQVLAFPVTGVVDKVFVQSGHKVTQGQKLAHLDLDPFKIQMKIMQAKVDRITPLLFDAQRDFDQAQELFERTVLSEVELQKIESILKGFKADNDQANAELELAKWQYARAQLKAPFNGRVIKQMLQAGQVVSVETMSEMKMEILLDGLMQVIFSVPADQLSEFQIGQNATVEVASERYPAIVKSIVSDANQQYHISLEFSSKPDIHYFAGQKAKVVF
ncbi:MAG: efflux RND transporter periplasmic adaptor subunit [Gammaproteobacteria bacterium]|nr:efflux RND transporter periplasmic adaptor subunit [Gammaproteobacteria bacterium]